MHAKIKLNKEIFFFKSSRGKEWKENNSKTKRKNFREILFWNERLMIWNVIITKWFCMLSLFFTNISFQVRNTVLWSDHPNGLSLLPDCYCCTSHKMLTQNANEIRVKLAECKNLLLCDYSFTSLFFSWSATNKCLFCSFLSVSCAMLCYALWEPRVKSKDSQLVVIYVSFSRALDFTRQSIFLISYHILLYGAL